MKSKIYKLGYTLSSKSAHLSIMLFVCSSILAQVPQKMSYQAVIRNASNVLLRSSPVGIQISILKGSSNGTVIYTETHTPNTNTNGLLSLEIGSGKIVTGIFTGIDWSAGPYFIQTETDLTGGTNYNITASSELMSVPYALHTEKAATATKLAAAKNINGVPFDGSTDIIINATGMPYFEKELTYDGENSIAISFSLVAASKIYYNGTLLRPSQWFGVGTNILKLLLDTRQKDQITITN